METKNPVTIDNFEDGLKQSSPMPLLNVDRKRKSGYDYLEELSNKLIASIKDGTSPLLPNAEGFVDLNPAYNFANNKVQSGLTQVMLLEKMKELGSPSNGFITFDMLKKAQDAGVDCKLMKGSKGVVIPIFEKGKIKEVDVKNNWFNLSQIENADALVAFYKEKMTEQWKKDVAYINEKHPDSDYAEKKNPAEKNMAKENKNIIPLNDKTTEAFQYIAQVINAMNTGRKLFVTPEQAAAFKTKAIQELTAEYEPGKRDLLAIKNITDKASYMFSKSQENLKKYQEKNNEQKIEKKPRTREPSHELGM